MPYTCHTTPITITQWDSRGEASVRRGTITVNHGATPQTFTVNTESPDITISQIGVNGTCGGSLNGNTYTTNPVTGNCTVQASFAINEYTVSTAAGQGGGIAPASAQVTHGNTAQFTITPDTGYHLLYAGGCNGTVSQSSLNAAAKKRRKGRRRLWPQRHIRRGR